MSDIDNPAQVDGTCRLCWGESMPERPLFYPCMCTGSIKFVHQECLVHWLKFSGKEYCEICTHRFSFTPVYAPDMPQQLPIRDVAAGIISSFLASIKDLLCFTLPKLTWAILVPLTACVIYRVIYYGLSETVKSMSTESIYNNFFHGYLIALTMLITVAILVIIREYILRVYDQDEPNNQQRLNVLLPRLREINPVEQADLEILPENENEDPGFIRRWNRLDGLNGALEFLKDLGCMVLLLALIISVLSFFPYQLGSIAIYLVCLENQVAASHFKRLVTTLCGYCFMGLCLFLLNAFVTFFGFRHYQGEIKLCQLVVKVFLLLLVEFGVLPLLCGWWLDICSLPMFNALFKDRLKNFHSAPELCMLIHWLFGIVVEIMFVVFIYALKEVVRPGVLWFLRDLINLNGHVIRDLSQQNVLEHGRRIITFATMLGTTIFVVLLLPLRILKIVWPSFLPYVIINEDNFIGYYLRVGVLFNLMVPMLVVITLRTSWLKTCIRNWCLFVSQLLGIRSYLLGDEDDPLSVVALIHPPAENLGAAHRRFLRPNEPERFQPYTRPTNFAVRLICLVILIILSEVIISLSVMTIPILLCRQFISFVTDLFLFSTKHFESTRMLHMYFTIFAMFSMMLMRVAILLRRNLPNRRHITFNDIGLLLKVGLKFVFTISSLVSVVSFLCGLLMHVTFLIPLQASVNQTQLFNVVDCWILGLIILYFLVVFALFKPNWLLRQVINRTFENGFLQFDHKPWVKDLATPLIAFLSLSISIPYVFAHSIVPLVVVSEASRRFIANYVYLIVLIVLIFGEGLMLPVRAFKKLYERIKNDKYLVRRELVNFNSINSNSSQN